MVVQFSTFAAFARAEPTNSIKIGHNFPQRGTVIPFIYGVNVCQCCQCTMFWQWYIYLDDRRKFLWFYVWFSCRKSADVKMRMRQGCQIDHLLQKNSVLQKDTCGPNQELQAVPRQSQQLHSGSSSWNTSPWTFRRFRTNRGSHGNSSTFMACHDAFSFIFHTFNAARKQPPESPAVPAPAAVPAGEGWLELVRSTTFCQDGWVAHVEFWGPRRWSLGTFIQSLKMQWKMLWTWYYFPWTGNQCNRWPTLNSGLDLIRLLTIHLMQESAQLKQQIKWDSTMIKSDLTPVNPISSYIYSYS